MKNDVKFPEGLRVYAPGKNAPEWVRGQLVLNKRELMDWLRSQDEEIRLDIKQSRKGSWYMSVSDFTPQQKGFFKKSDFEDPFASPEEVMTAGDDLPF